MAGKQGTMVRMVLPNQLVPSITYSLHLLTFLIFHTLTGFGGGGGGGGMIVLVNEAENYIDNGMTVAVYGGAEGMGEIWEDHKGWPGSDGQKYINGVVV